MATTSSADPKGRNKDLDAIALLTADHRTVKELFRKFGIQEDDAAATPRRTNSESRKSGEKRK